MYQKTTKQEARDNFGYFLHHLFSIDLILLHKISHAMYGEQLSTVSIDIFVETLFVMCKWQSMSCE